MDDRDQVAAIARLEAQVAAMADSMAELKAMARSQSAALQTVQQQLAQAQGGLRVVMWLGGAAATAVGGLVVWAAKHLHWQ